MLVWCRVLLLALYPSYSVSDLHASTLGNHVAKYADDTYLIVPACNSATIPSELKHISDWAVNNSLKLNAAKSTEMIVCNKNFPRKNCPPPTLGLTRLTEITVLGVLLTNDLSMSPFVQSIVSKGNRSLKVWLPPVNSHPYILRTRSHKRCLLTHHTLASKKLPS